MKKITNAQKILNNLVGTELKYGWKSHDMDFFAFDFGETVKIKNLLGQECEAGRYSIHLTCDILVCRNDGCRCLYNSQTDHRVFAKDIKMFIGSRVKGVALTQSNGLKLLFEDCTLEIVCRDDGDESWRFLERQNDAPHIVSYGNKVCLE